MICPKHFGLLIFSLVIALVNFVTPVLLVNKTADYDPKLTLIPALVSSVYLVIIAIVYRNKLVADAQVHVLSLESSSSAPGVLTPAAQNDFKPHVAINIAEPARRRGTEPK